MRSLSASDPRVIGPYRLSALLGAGGMGRVYLGTEPGGATVAVKVVRAEYAYDSGFRGRFTRELDLTGRVHGDFTPRVLNADPAGTPPWMATEYVAGPSLHDLVRRTGPLPEDTVRFLARGMATALARVHALGTVHRDLKPGNVMVSASGPQVIDFGVAGALEDGEDSEETLVSGTPGYMAPEQAAGSEVTSASDVFALGGVLAYALTGTGPYGDGHPAAVVFRIANREPVLDGIPEGLRSVVTACLSRDPRARPTAAWVLEELGGPVSPAMTAEGWLPEVAAQWVERVAEETAGFLSPDRSRALVDRSDGAGRDAVGWPRRWPVAAGAGATALLLFTGLAGWAVTGREGDVEQSDSRASGCDLPGDLPSAYVEAARTEATVPGADIHHLDGDLYPTLTFLEGGDLLAVAHPEGIALWETESGEEVAYVGADLPDFSGAPVVSPDGCRFGYAASSRSLHDTPKNGAHVFDLRTGEHTAHAPDRTLRALAFAPDGQSFTVNEMEGVYEVDLESGEVGTVIMEDYTEMDYSPSGDHLGVISGASVAVMDTRTGDRVFLDGEDETGTNMPAMVLPNDDGDLLYIREEGIFRANFLTDSEPRLVASSEDVPYGFNTVFASSETDRFFALYRVDDGDDFSMRIAAWEYSSGERLPIDGGRQNVRSVAVHPTGEIIAGLSQDGRSVWLLDPDTFEVVAEFG